MYFVAINGSPHQDGNTVFLLKKGLEQLKLMGAQTGFIHTAEILKSTPIPFCTACSAPCRGDCAQGTRLAEVLHILRKADGLLLGSPVYFGTVSGQLKAFWDKIRCLRAEKKLLNVVGGAVAVGASRFGGQEGTLRTMQEMMLVQGMTIIGGGQQDYDCGHYGVAAQSPVEEDQYAQERIVIMVKRLFEVAQATQSLRC
ncbi:MAG TPA: flavodoxin family protein [Clostridia bacterium]|jgi:multimeric flavodoxin WrbA|nr:flavodoxin family protein [Clostridia bacterium]